MFRSNKWLVGLLVVLVVASLGASACRKADVEVGPLVVGTEATFPPFEFTDEAGNVIGFDIDLIKAIARELDREISIVDMDFGGLIGALNAGHIDVIVAGMTITEERARQISFSAPYYDASQGIFVLEADTTITEPAHLAGKTVAVQMGTTGADEADAIAGANVKHFRKVNEAFLELKLGRADAVIIDYPVGRAYAAKMGGIKLAGEPFTEEQFGIGVRKADTILLAEIDAALAAIRDSGEYDEILDRWFGEDAPD